MSTSASHNPQIQLAEAYLENTGVSLFLTGKAGTGKTTFLRNFKKKTAKRLIVAAPTGVAAINAGGVTLHSFFQLPFGPFVPGSELHEQGASRKFSREKRNIIKSLDLVVIDEISMVRADLLDGVDTVLRRLRRSEQPFGGVQLLMIGDLHQLPPVVKEDEWVLLREYYDSPYFFSSQALNRTDFITVELQHIYRQSDTHFIELLNRVRDNTLDAITLAELNKQHRPDFSPGENDGYITLCTHNRRADAINEEKLAAIHGKAHRLEAKVEGEFPEYAYPTTAQLELKVGAQVMFVKNDPSPDKLYFNGRIGRVVRISHSKETVWVKCANDSHEIAVEPETWDNIKYSLEPETQTINEEKIGSFIQYPLKLAWAITIHKSQGLTFDRAVIDAGAAFAHGQVYVALSRCRTMEGLVLRSPLPRSAVRTDVVVRRFSENARQNPPEPEHYKAAQLSYQQRLMTECFDFGRLRHRLYQFTLLLGESARVIRVSWPGDRNAWQQEVEEGIFTVGGNFQRQLEKLFTTHGLPETDAVLNERAIKASAWFCEKIEKLWMPFLNNFQVDTDNKEIRKRIKDAMERLHQETAVRLAAIRSCQSGFSPGRYLRAISAADLEEPSAASAKVPARREVSGSTDIRHPELFLILKEWRTAKAAELGVSAFQILHQNVLLQIVDMLPNTIPALKTVRGIGPRLAQKYGDTLVAMVRAYREKHNITDSPQSGQQNGSDQTLLSASGSTKRISFELFQSGLTVEEIAEKRGLVPSTIEGHLVDFVSRGELDVGRLVPADTRQAIEAVLDAMPGQPLGEIKKALGEACTYGAIRFVNAHRKAGESLAK